MRIVEVAGGLPDSDDNLVTTLEFLRNRAHNKKLTPVISTQSLINMIKNQGGSEFFGFENLMRAQETNPAVRDLVKNIDKEKVTLNGFGDETDADSIEQADTNSGTPPGQPDPQKTVKSMAKSALAKRS